MRLLFDDCNYFFVVGSLGFLVENVYCFVVSSNYRCVYCYEVLWCGECGWFLVVCYCFFWLKYFIRVVKFIGDVSEIGLLLFR